MNTVKQVAALSGVTPRTLHHYDAIGLLKPSRVGDNGYRWYDEEALLRLQQILLYRELGLGLGARTAGAAVAAAVRWFRPLSVTKPLSNRSLVVRSRTVATA